MTRSEVATVCETRVTMIRTSMVAVLDGCVLRKANRFAVHWRIQKVMSADMICQVQYKMH